MLGFLTLNIYAFTIRLHANENITSDVRSTSDDHT